MIRTFISKFNAKQETASLDTDIAQNADAPVLPIEKTKNSPLLSVVVPCYKVESYLRGTLDTILAQNEIPIEVIVVDDGSPDRSGDIAREYAANDPRIIVITQPNSGLGAARNTGIQAATAKYLTFADSDDYIPRGAYKAMVSQLEQSGSDFVVGSVERKRGMKTWIPEWAQNVHAVDRIGGSLGDDPELLKDVFAWNKVFRRTFWDENIREFPVDIRYEDQTPTAIAYTTSTKFDVLKRVVYTWVIRDDGTSITQQKAKIEDLQDRLKVMRSVARVLQDNSTEEIFDQWLLKSVGFDLKPYYEQIPRTDHDYWAELAAGIRFLNEFMDQGHWNEIPFWERTIALSLLNGTQEDVTLILQKKQEDGAGYQITAHPELGLTCATDFLESLSFVPEKSLLTPADSSLRLRAELISFNWDDQSFVANATVATWISGLSPNNFDYEVSAELIGINDDLIALPAEVKSIRIKPELVPSGDAYNTYEKSTYSVRIDTRKLAVPEGVQSEDLKWALQLHVRAGEISRDGQITARTPLGSAVAFSHGTPVDGVRYAIHYDDKLGLVVNVPTPKPLATSISLDGRSFVLRVDKRSSGDFNHLVLRSKHKKDLSFLASEITDDELVFRVSLPLFEETLVGSALWELRLANRHSSALIQSGQSSASLQELLSFGRRLRVSLSPNGFLRLEERDFGISVNGAYVDEGNHDLVIEGRYRSPHGSETRLFFENSAKARILPHTYRFDEASGEFEIRFSLEQTGSNGQKIAFAEGGYALIASRAGTQIGDKNLWVPVDLSLHQQLPIHSLTEKSRIRMSRTVKAGALWLNIYPRIAYSDATKNGQKQLILSSSGKRQLVDATLFESFAGSAIADSPLALFREAIKRGVGGKLYWTVKDHGVPVPAGATPVVLHSAEYHEILSTAKWLVNNNNFPYYFSKQPGQRYVQTWHGTPLKKIGNDVPSGNLSISYRELMKREALQWDFLIAQNEYASERLANAFGYDGRVLELGYPRNDSLVTGQVAESSGDLRSRLGISPDQHVVLYAPTWRDNIRTASNHYDLVSYLDFNALAKAFGDSVVVLLRGHSNTVAANRQFSNTNVIDVSRHPDINEVMLASDSLVTDYSSIMFDYATLKRPIYVLAPDIEDYASSTRGFYYEFEQNLPGPLFKNTGELIKLLKKDPVAYLYRVRNYANQFAPKDDGQASSRVADKIWG